MGLLMAAIAVIGAEPSNTSALAPSVPAGPDAPRAITRRPMPKAEWLDPDRGAPNGTQYKTFQSKLLGREVSYLVYLPPGYGQEKQRYPVIYSATMCTCSSAPCAGPPSGGILDPTCWSPTRPSTLKGSPGPRSDDPCKYP
jgi:hypothetical protein